MSENKCTGSFSFIISAEWDFVGKGKAENYLRDRFGISMTERLALDRAAKLLIANSWKPYHCVEDITAVSWDDREGYVAGKKDETKAWLYGEFLYFTNKVRPLVYNLCDSKEGNEEFLRNLKKRKPACVILERKLKDDGNNQENHTNRYFLVRDTDYDYILYSLPLSSIQLRLYASGVMTLSICCNNEKNAKENNILKKTINKSLSDSSFSSDKWDQQLSIDQWDKTDAGDIAWIRDGGRRLFWPYGCIYGVYHPKEAPVYSALQLGDKSIVLCDYRAILGKGKTRITKPEYFDWTQKLICDQCVTRMKMRGSREQLPLGDLLVIQYFNDDRMYLHNTIVSPEYSDKVKEGWTHRQGITNANKSDQKLKNIWEDLRIWYAILAADSNWHNATCQDADMLIRKCEEATDARWMDYGSFYGLYYNAITQLISSDDNSTFSRNMDWMYYQMFLLAIMQRSSIQRFYREASGAAVHRSRRKASKLSGALKEKYVFFMNSMWFTEVTEQEQGCDFFEKLRSNMGLEQDMSLLKDAIAEMNAVTESNLENAVSNALLPATIVGLIVNTTGGLAYLFTTSNGLENAFAKDPFPWLLSVIGLGFGALVWLYYRLRSK